MLVIIKIRINNKVLATGTSCACNTMHAPSIHAPVVASSTEQRNTAHSTVLRRIHQDVTPSPVVARCTIAPRSSCWALRLVARQSNKLNELHRSRPSPAASHAHSGTGSARPWRSIRNMDWGSTHMHRALLHALFCIQHKAQFISQCT